MEFFGVGAPELMVILVIAIVLFGPDKIPTMAAQVGKTIREFRRYTSDLTKEFDAATGDLRQEFQTIAGDLRGELEATQADLRNQLDLTDVFKPDVPKEPIVASLAATGGVEATSVAAVPEIAEPLPAVETTVIEPITVTTPYADALAAAARAQGEMPETAPAVAIATKADPFADLATLVVGRSAADVVTVTADATETVVAPITTESVVPESSVPAMVVNGKPKVIGASVSGSKYRRKSR